MLLVFFSQEASGASDGQQDPAGWGGLASWAAKACFSQPLSIVQKVPDQEGTSPV